MPKCTALGWACAVGDGPCPRELSIDVAVKLMERAIDKAQEKASEECKKGCVCRGKGMPVGEPSCNEFHLKGRLYHVWMVTATFDGECVCPDEKKG